MLHPPIAWIRSRVRWAARSTRLPADPIIIALVCLLAGCASPTRHATESPRAFRFEPVSLERRVGDCSTDTASCARVALRWFHVTSRSRSAVAESLDRAIQAWLLEPLEEGTVLSRPDSLVQQFLESYGSFAREFPESPQKWILEKRAHLLLDSLDVVSFEFEDSSYTGGAHANASLEFANFDARTGHRIRLDDLFVEGSDDIVRGLAEREFRRVRRLGTDARLPEAGFFRETGAFSLSDHFAITRAGLTFHYNAYEIGSYADGPTTLTLSYDALSAVVRKPGPLAPFTSDRRAATRARTTSGRAQPRSARAT